MFTSVTAPPLTITSNLIPPPVPPVWTSAVQSIVASAGNVPPVCEKLDMTTAESTLSPTNPAIVTLSLLVVSS